MHCYSTPNPSHSPISAITQAMDEEWFPASDRRNRQGYIECVFHSYMA